MLARLLVTSLLMLSTLAGFGPVGSIVGPGSASADLK